MAQLLSVNVGLPRDIAWKGRTVHTGVWKNRVTDHCRVGRLNLEGDGQGDLAGHGGEHRAVFVYQIKPNYCAFCKKGSLSASVVTKRHAQTSG
jgi:MOSC domain-containing protein YiiM